VHKEPASRSVDRIEQQLDKLDSKIDMLVSTQAALDKTLALNTQSLLEHMKRTELLEAVVQRLDKAYLKASIFVSVAIGAFAILKDPIFKFLGL